MPCETCSANLLHRIVPDLGWNSRQNVQVRVQWHLRFGRLPYEVPERLEHLSGWQVLREGQ